jgi:hypothetical protein
LQRAQPGASSWTSFQGCQGRILVFNDEPVRT